MTPLLLRVCHASPAHIMLRLVAGHCGVALDVKPSSDSTPELSTGAGPIRGPATVARYLVEHAPGGGFQAMLGTTPEASAEISEWLSRCSADLAAGPFDGSAEPLVSLSARLLTRAYVMGPAMTLADIVLFCTLHSSVLGLLPEEAASLAPLCRWVDLMQHVVDPNSLYERVVFKHAAFSPPAKAPPVAAVKAAGAPKGDGGAKDVVKAPSAAPTPVTPVEAPNGGKVKAGKATEAVATSHAPAKAKADKEPSAAAVAGDGAAGDKALPPVSILDIRVGKITAVKRHPGADALYVEEIDLGEGKPRQVVSGLVKFIPESRMLGARCLVLANVKPGKLRDVMSEAMVLCASNDDHTAVDFVVPPAGAPLGERITFPGIPGEPEAVLVPKKKQFEALAPLLRVDAAGVARYGDVPLTSAHGPCTSSLHNAHIK